MEYLIPILLVGVGAISLISKIVGFKNKASSPTPVQLADGKPEESLLSDFLNEVFATPKPVPPPIVKPSPQKAIKLAKPKVDPRKPLIPEEAAPPPPLPPSAKIKDSIADSEIGSDNPLNVDLLKSDRRFAIICHEVLGKPKALRN